MKHLKTILCATVFFLSVAIPAFAEEVQPSVAPIEQFTAADMHLLFEQDAQPMQLAVLSQEEMRETEGALIPAMIYGATIGFGAYAFTNWGNMTWHGALGSAALGAISLGSTAIAGKFAAMKGWEIARKGWKIAYHGPHHSFPIIGKSSHIQLIRWTPNVSGSHKKYRLPW